MSEIGNILDKHIKDTGISQGAVARTLKVATTTIHNWRIGASTPKNLQLDELRKYLDGVGINLDSTEKVVREPSVKYNKQNELLERISELEENYKLLRTALNSLLQRVELLERNNHQGKKSA
jgi:hypothetical protein